VNRRESFASIFRMPFYESVGNWRFESARGLKIACWPTARLLTRIDPVIDRMDSRSIIPVS
jgi:hypothetical protein